MTLFEAVLSGDRVRVQSLIDGKADVNKPNQNGVRVVDIVCAYGDNLCLKILLDAKVNINLVNRFAMSPLYIATSTRALPYCLGPPPPVCTSTFIAPSTPLLLYLLGPPSSVCP